MKTEEKYTKLKELLDDNKKWPLRYMFKVIIPNNGNKVDLAKALMPKGSQLKFKHTPSLKYVSMTCVTTMKSSNAIIALTQKLEGIDGVISL
ncbi:MAG: hypothetical protein PF444_04320 [Bacteroidales bacterium]|nr:hypothetical protein [Bacteroidales bacterium]